MECRCNFLQRIVPFRPPEGSLMDWMKINYSNSPQNT
jgi:hypothetical protein